MTEDTLRSLSKRSLSNDQIVATLKNHEPRVVLAGIEHAAGNMGIPEIKAGVEKVFDTDNAISQFRNEIRQLDCEIPTLFGKYASLLARP